MKWTSKSRLAPWTSKSLLIASLLVSGAAFAAPTDVRLDPKQIEAARLLMQVQDTSFLFDGLTAHFLPGSTLAIFGVKPADFPIDLGSIGDLADVRFNAIRARGLEIALENGRLRVEIPFDDREKAIRSTIGAVHFRGVRAVVWVRPVESLVGTLSLVEDGAELRGGLVGSGLIGPGLIAKIRAAVVAQIRKRIGIFLSGPTVMDGIEKGIVRYAQFSKDPALERYVPATLKVDPAGISYQAE